MSHKWIDYHRIYTREKRKTEVAKPNESIAYKNVWMNAK